MYALDLIKFIEFANNKCGVEIYKCQEIYRKLSGHDFSISPFVHKTFLLRAHFLTHCFVANSHTFLVEFFFFLSFIQSIRGVASAKQGDEELIMVAVVVFSDPLILYCRIGAFYSSTNYYSQSCFNILFYKFSEAYFVSIKLAKKNL